MIDRRAVALQGVGFGRRLLAFQGLRPTTDIPPSEGAGGSWMARPAGKRDKKRRRDEEVLLLLMIQ